MTYHPENKADQDGNQPTEEETKAAWEIRNGIMNVLENSGSLGDWTEQYIIDDDMLRDYIEACVTTGIEQWQIGNIAAAINQCRRKTEPDASPVDERDPFSLTGLWRLELAWAIDTATGTAFDLNNMKPHFRSFEAYVEYLAEHAGDYLYELDWSKICEERQEMEQYRAREEAEEQTKMAADPYEWVRVNDGPPLLGYHDRHQLLPRYRDGGIGLIVGEKNHLKTTVTIVLLVEAMVADPDLHILYLAGEQPGDVLNKVRHYGAAAGLTVDDILGRFRIRKELPPLHLPGNTGGVLATAEKYNADIVIVDTYQHAITGLDENSSKAAELSTNTGIFGRLKSGGRLVLILGHPPADGSPRFRGNTGIEGAADFVITFRATHGKGSFKADVINMRGTAAGAIAYATFPKVPSNLTEEQRLTLPPPDITWSTVKEYKSATNDPRSSAPAPVPTEPASPAPAPVSVSISVESSIEPERPLTRAEKNAEYQRQHKLRKKAAAAASSGEPAVW